MGESRRSKSQSSLCRLGAVHHNNGLMSKHTERLMNKLLVPRNSFSLLKIEKKKKAGLLPVFINQKREGAGRENMTATFCAFMCVCAYDPL